MVEGRSKLVEIEADFRMQNRAGTGIAIWVGEKDPRSGMEKWVWLPAVHVQQDGNTFTMPSWLAREKGLI